MYGARYRFRTNCTGANADPIRIVWDPMQIPYGLYGTDTDPIRSVWDPIQIPYGMYGSIYRPHTECMGLDTASVRTVWGPIQIPCGVYGIRYRPHTDCVGADTDPMQSVWDTIQTSYGLYEHARSVMRHLEFCLRKILLKSCSRSCSAVNFLRIFLSKKEFQLSDV